MYLRINANRTGQWRRILRIVRYLANPYGPSPSDAARHPVRRHSGWPAAMRRACLSIETGYIAI
jgi:hypothetical protein